MTKNRPTKLRLDLENALLPHTICFWIRDRRASAEEGRRIKTSNYLVLHRTRRQCQHLGTTERGSIPGYYFDEDKKKYFKITANHIAPPEAKFSKSNVNYESREKKKQKLEDKQNDKRHQQTVRPSRVLERPFSTGGIGLQRELGRREHVNDLIDRDAFLVSQLKPMKREHPRSPNRHGGTLFDTAAIEGTGDRLLGYNYNGFSTVNYEDCVRGTRTCHLALHGPLVSLSSFFRGDVDTLIVCTQHAGSPNLYIGNTSSGHGIRLQLGGSDSSLWASSISPESGGLQQLAVSGTDAVYVVDIATVSMAHSVSLKEESRAVTWLDNKTIAFGSGRKVMLFDTRSSGGITRFQRSKPVTAIDSLEHSGVHLLVADNKHLELYDTRMEKMPLLGFPHIHQGPQLQMTCRDSLVAAVDVNNHVQTYSLRTGRGLGKLQRPEGKGESLLTRLRWTEMDGVPGLRACQDRSLVHWRIGGEGKDDD
ncbi:hypothetical protein LTR08_003111 [Meristemomyces frigidus]|nr:hypothetical protein LTR08_003111 [Meristemomyces frigidus]